MVYRPTQVYNGSGWDDIGDKRIGAEAGDIPQASVEDLTSDLASKLPYSYGTATPSTTDSGFLWYDSNSTPPAPKFWDGAAFQALTSGKILQVVRATDSTQRSTTSGTYVDVAGMSVTITPTKSDSAILLQATFVGQALRGSGTDVRALFQITDSSNNAISGANGSSLLDLQSGNSEVPVVLQAYATPATTSAVTYKLRFASGLAGTVTARVNNNLSVGQLFAWEISA